MIDGGQVFRMVIDLGLFALLTAFRLNCNRHCLCILLRCTYLHSEKNFTFSSRPQSAQLLAGKYSVNFKHLCIKLVDESARRAVVVRSDSTFDNQISRGKRTINIDKYSSTFIYKWGLLIIKVAFVASKEQMASNIL